jgi:hypothetical protein
MLTIVSGVLLRSGLFTVITLIIGCSINRRAPRVMRRNCKDCVTNISPASHSPENRAFLIEYLPGTLRKMLQLRDIAARPDRNTGSTRVRPEMLITLTVRERATILASLRRWLSYPAAREADSIATNGGKHRPLDNAEIELVCKRLTKIEGKRDAAPLLRRSSNGARERKASQPKMIRGHSRPNGSASEIRSTPR